jgi:CBS domain-containing protein
MNAPLATPRAAPTAASRRDACARDIMTTDPFTIDGKARVLEAAKQMVARGVSNAPVVYEDFSRKLLVGFVSEKDLMQCYASGRLYSQPDLQVGEIMRTHPVAVRPEADLFTLAAIFMQHGFRHVPVVAANMLQGIVSRRDVLAALLEHHREWERQDPATRKAPDLAGIFTPRYLLG